MDTREYDAIRAEVAASRAKQGLPPVIEDPETVAKVAALLADVRATAETVIEGGARDGP